MSRKRRRKVAAPASISSATIGDQSDQGTKRTKTKGQHAYKEVEKNNQLFETYYKGQNIVAQDEWDDFMSRLREPLPQTFRITGIRSHAKFVAKCVETMYFGNWKIEEGKENIVLPQALPWYPDQLAWSIPMPKKTLRKSAHLSQFHQFLISETEQGNISRQETVSVVPPLLLDVKPHHKVLDMCAAPGSKTAQIIELLHAEDNPTKPSSAMPSGFVVANDKDNKRCYMLVHQTKRLLSPCCIIINEDASILPNLYLESAAGTKEKVEFDRILCDVPCSGDGTLRKNFLLWKRWVPTLGTQLHRLQQRILCRGIELLAVGGRLVYSTCSLNPVENEAVVASVLEMSKGAVELIDVSGELIELKRSEGLHTWKVMSKSGKWFSSFSDVPDSLKGQLLSTMFPLTSDSHHLERCIRILPHQQNTGGFFIAVLTKKRPVPWQRQKTKKAEENPASPAPPSLQESPNNDDEPKGREEKGNDLDETEIPSKSRSKQKKKGQLCFRENPFIFLKGDEPVWPQIKQFFGLDDFPVNQLVVRSSGGKRRIYATSKAVKQLIELNEKKIKIINAGVRVFDGAGSHGSSCQNRLAQEGLNVVLPFLKQRQVFVPLSDMAVLLRQLSAEVSLLTPSSKTQLSKLDTGSLVFTYDSTKKECQSLSDGDGESEKPKEEIAVVAAACRIDACGWMGTIRARLLINKADRNHLLLVLGLATPDDVEDKAKTEAKRKKARQKDSAPAESENEEESLALDEEEQKTT